MNAPLTARQIWVMPVVLAMSSAVGLVSGLVGDGIWDMVSCVGLALPLALIIRSLANILCATWR